MSLRHDFVYYLCPDRLRLPLIFYYGHTAAVYVNKMCLAGLIKVISCFITDQLFIFSHILPI